MYVCACACLCVSVPVCICILPCTHACIPTFTHQHIDLHDLHRHRRNAVSVTAEVSRWRPIFLVEFA